MTTSQAGNPHGFRYIGSRCRTKEDPRFVRGDYDTSLLASYDGASRNGAAGASDLTPVVAAALALHRRAPPAAGSPPPAGTTTDSAWVRAGRPSWDATGWPR